MLSVQAVLAKLPVVFIDEGMGAPSKWQHIVRRVKK